MVREATAPVANERWAAFIQGGVSIVAASCDARNIPTIVRCVGCRVSADRRKVTLLVSSSQAGNLLNNIRSGGAIAVVFSQPSTHVSIQLKGTDAKSAPIRAGDADLAERYTSAFAADLLPLGYHDTFVRALLGHETSELVSVTFTPAAA